MKILTFKQAINERGLNPHQKCDECNKNEPVIYVMIGEYHHSAASYCLCFDCDQKKNRMYSDFCKINQKELAEQLEGFTNEIKRCN